MKKVLLIAILMLILAFPLYCQEENSPMVTGGEGENKETQLQNSSFIVCEKDYLTIRNESQNDSIKSTTPYNGYYKIESVNEPFNFRKNGSNNQEIQSFPDNKIEQKGGYSGYYNKVQSSQYKFPTANTLPSSTSNAIDCSSSIMNVDIGKGGVPVWKQNRNVIVRVNNQEDKNVDVFQLTQPKNNKIVGYNLEFTSNRGDEFSSTSFLLEPSSKEVYILSKGENGQEKEENIGNYREDKRGIFFNYKTKEVTLQFDSSSNNQQNQQINQEKPETSQPEPVFNKENKNTVLEVNL